MVTGVVAAISISVESAVCVRLITGSARNVESNSVNANIRDTIATETILLCVLGRNIPYGTPSRSISDTLEIEAYRNSGNAPRIAHCNVPD